MILNHCGHLKTSVRASLLRRAPRGASHEKFHAAPSKKQARFLEGALSLRTQGKSDLPRSPFASKKVLRGTFRGLPPFAPLLILSEGGQGVGGGGCGQVGRGGCAQDRTGRAQHKAGGKEIWVRRESEVGWIQAGGKPATLKFFSTAYDWTKKSLDGTR